MCCAGWLGKISGNCQKSKAPELISGAFTDPDLCSDAHTELCGLSLVAGVRVKVAWSAAFEFVTQA
jgi:hypothetical protein